MIRKDWGVKGKVFMKRLWDDSISVMKRKRELLFNLLMTVFCLGISIFCLAKCRENYYLMFMQPILFLVFYYISYRKILFSRKSVFKLALGVAIFIRYVIMPFLNGIVGYSTWSPNVPSYSDYTLAQIMMMGEIIIITIVFKISNSAAKDINDDKIIIDNRSDVLLVLFTIVSLLLFFILKDRLGINLHIIVPNEDTAFFGESNMKQILMLLFNVAKAFSFLFILKKVFIKKKKTIFDIIIVLVFGAFNVLVYTGTNRMQLIISFICSIYLIVAVFPKLKKKMLVVALFSLLIIIPAVSSFRKSELLTPDSTVGSYSQLANSYLGGVDNVAISVETSDAYPQYRNFGNFIYDMFRGVLGVNVLLKDNTSNILSSDLYNNVYFGHGNNLSQIIPIAGQGYYYFGIVGFWIIELFFLIVGIKLEKIFKKTTNIYLKYTILFILMRFSIMQGLSGTILAHSISFDCFIPWLIIILNNVFNSRRGLTYEKECS